MSELAIRADNLSKSYRIVHSTGLGRYKTLRDDLTRAATAPFRRLRRLATGTPDPRRETFWALNDISFEINEGEVVGIIGRNGAGKSTLLKLLSRITEPTRGQAEIYGRVGSLLEVGTGFHPELTGRENIYLSGAILGMTRKEVDRKFDEIVAFAEVEKFLDTPAKHYSSGMYVRLAFAVAAHLEPEILLVDEVLAVGDAVFQRKCLGKMDQVAKTGRTVLFVSHNMATIAQLCPRVILLSHGQIVMDADASSAITHYLSQLQDSSSTASFEDDPAKSVQITSIALTSIDGESLTTVPHTQPFCLVVDYRVTKWNVGSYVCVDVYNEAEIRLLWSADTATVGEMLIDRAPGTYRAKVTIPGNVLAPGRYSFTSAIYAPGRIGVYDVKDRAVHLEVIDGGSFLSNFGIKPHSATMVPLTWNTERVGKA